MMGSRIDITLREVGGMSACGELEAEGQEYFALCFSEALLNQKYRLSAFDPHYSIIPREEHKSAVTNKNL